MAKAKKRTKKSAKTRTTAKAPRKPKARVAAVPEGSEQETQYAIVHRNSDKEALAISKTFTDESDGSQVAYEFLQRINFYVGDSLVCEEYTEALKNLSDDDEGRPGITTIY